MQLADLTVNFESGAHRPQRIVVMGDRSAKHGHDIVADMLVDRAAIVRNDGVHSFEIAIE